MAASRLNKGLRLAGQDSQLFVMEGDQRDPKLKVFSPNTGIQCRFARFIRKLLLYPSQRHMSFSKRHGHDGFISTRSIYGTEPLEYLQDADIVNLHWINRFIDLPSFFRTIPERIPVVWTMHDMNPFTGGCYYDEECGRFRTGCHACPQLAKYSLTNPARRIWNHKKRLYRRIPPRRICLVGPCRWIASQAMESGLTSHWRTRVIPYGIDTDEFAPRDKAFARSVLGIPQHSKVLLFLVGGSPRRKGLYALARIAEALADDPRMVIATMGPVVAILPANIAHANLGVATNPRLLSLVYSATDAFLMLSQQDNLPNTVLEAMACGTPVAAFSVGGVPDMVQHGYNGLLCPHGDADGLAALLKQHFNDPACFRQMGANARQRIEQEFSLRLQAQRYTDLYHELLDQNPRK